MTRLAALLLALTLLPTHAAPASAGLTRDELSSVGFADRTGRLLPVDAMLTDANGVTRSLGERLGGRAALVAFVDYTCETVCGVAANALAAAEATLKDRSDLAHAVLVLGFDPRDTGADQAKWLTGNEAAASLGKDAFLLADAETTRRLVQAAGLKTFYDADRDQYAHPAGALLLDNEGRVLRPLDLVSLEPETLRLAIVDASNGEAGSLVDQLVLSCYGWNAETGRYTSIVNSTVLVAGCGTVLLIAGLLAVLLLRERRFRGGPAAGGASGASADG
ncbi:electron transporter [Aurantimonas sp. VKM B-3413]|uniref:SCO family protein n=1 Tax=Aurantimonas sp. VKM B-3413 TaxID=2779401 RepID=UPI001E38D776|nr:electron transporter [Aurantimonas sp. VKM B-3413]MCB8839665.1 electron transporter [Aurantimonas sp. VKM B-3413]